MALQMLRDDGNIRKPLLNNSSMTGINADDNLSAAAKKDGFNIGAYKWK